MPHVNVKPSRFMLMYLVLIHVLAFFAILMMDCSVLIHFMLSAVLILSFLYYFKRALRSFHVDLPFRNNDFGGYIVQGKPILGEYWLLLSLKTTDGNSIRLFLAADQMDLHHFSQLKGELKLI